MKHRHKFPKVQVKYKEGSPPNLILMEGNDADGEGDTVRMDSWKIEDILEFLHNTFDSKGG